VVQLLLLHDLNVSHLQLLVGLRQLAVLGAQIMDGCVLGRCQATRQHAHHFVRQGWLASQQCVEIEARHLQQLERGARADAGRAAMLGIEQAHFADETTGLAHAEQALVGRAQLLHDLNQPVHQNEEAVCVVAFMEQHLARRHLQLPQARGEVADFGRRQRRKQRHLVEIHFPHAVPSGSLTLSPELGPNSISPAGSDSIRARSSARSAAASTGCPMIASDSARGWRTPLAR
jgi:hypothetical protein